MKKALAAISDNTRLRIMTILAKGEICACELPERVGVSQPAVSQHLQVLLDANIAKARVDGRKRLYSLTAFGKKVLGDIESW